MSAPIPNLFPALDAATEAALRESITRFGVLVPVVRDQHGRTLDGHHRSRLADDVGVKYRVDVVQVRSDEEAREIAATLNTDRRQLAPEQRREIVAALREQGHSFRAIAGAVGVGVATVHEDAERSGVRDRTPDESVGQDGKRYPAKRPTVVATKDQREADRAQTALTTSPVPDGRVIDTKRVERIAREQQAEQRRAEPVEPITVMDAVEIHHGDFRDVLPPLDLVGGVVITDPPYPREYIGLWADMAECALDWGCEAIVAMTGQSILPDALDAIRRAYAAPLVPDDDERRWHYRWCGAYLTIGPATRVWNANVGTSWKPILVFDRGDERAFLTSDLFRSTGDDKNHHYWGQNENGIAALVEAFTDPGDLVIDPFLGGGTTAVVCKALGRRFVGCDVDGAAVDSTRRRLAA